MPEEDLVEIDGETYAIGVLTGSLGFLTRVTQIQEREFIRRSGQTTVSPGVYSALATIETNPGIRQGALASLLMIKESNMTAFVRQLTAKGMIERRRHAGNHRVTSLWLTKKGQNSVGRARERMQDLDRRFADMLSDAEYSLAIGTLQRLFKHHVKLQDVRLSRAV
jgi:DNA-binding MarR family transcriptional regulator